MSRPRVANTNAAGTTITPQPSSRSGGSRGMGVQAASASSATPDM